jgi:hypothetical protein
MLMYKIVHAKIYDSAMQYLGMNARSLNTDKAKIK